MAKMKIATTSIKFDPKQNVNEVSIYIRPNAEILSVQQLKNFNNILKVTFMYPSETTNPNDQKRYFIINKCFESEIESNDYQYISTFSVDHDTYTVFYKK